MVPSAKKKEIFVLSLYLSISNLLLTGDRCTVEKHGGGTQGVYSPHDIIYTEVLSSCIIVKCSVTGKAQRCCQQVSLDVLQSFGAIPEVDEHLIDGILLPYMGLTSKKGICPCYFSLHVLMNYTENVTELLAHV